MQSVNNQKTENKKQKRRIGKAAHKKWTNFQLQKKQKTTNRKQKRKNRRQENLTY